MRHLFVINPKSFITAGGWREFLLNVEGTFSVGKRAEYKIYISRYPRDAIAAVRRYIESVKDDETVRVYAVGGDGILFDCLNGIIKYPNAELASIPYGNSNDFIEAFGKNKEHLFRNIKLMSRAPSVPTDVIQCGVNYAICSCSFGIEGAAVLRMNDIVFRLQNFNGKRGIIKALYQLGAVLHIFDSDNFWQKYALSFDGVDWSGDYCNIQIANVFGNGKGNTPSPYAVPNDGWLDAVLFKKSGKLKTLARITGYTKGEFEKYPRDFFHTRFKSMEIASGRPMQVILDGETFNTKKISMMLIPNAVKIVVPDGLDYVKLKEYKSKEADNA